MMNERYTFLFSAIDCVGHVNACIGLAEALRDRGHNIVFALPVSWKGKLVTQGFQEELFEEEDYEVTEVGHGRVHWGIIFADGSEALALSPLQFHQNYQVHVTKKQMEQIKFSDGKLREIVERIKPNVIIVDHYLHVPALMDQGIPWILSRSLNPMGISEENVPPGESGYPTGVDGDRSEWEKLREGIKSAYKLVEQEYKNWIISRGGSLLKDSIYPTSRFANIYMYPAELDYTSLRPNPPNWHQFDAFVRKREGTFRIPPTIDSGQGKLIYFSLGTIGCMELNLMKRLIGILSKSTNRFIVSKGPLGDKLELGRNMWGANSLPQTKVIPLVDLVITHGGNNTVLETFYFGKRMIVLPLLWDQLDNAQRIEETGHGIQFHPLKVTESELLSGIEAILSDVMLDRRMISISKRIHASKSQARAAELIEGIAVAHKESVKANTNVLN